MLTFMCAASWVYQMICCLKYDFGTSYNEKASELTS